MKRKASIEDKIVFLSNTLGSLMLGFYFGGLETIVGYLLGAYCLFNIYCYLIVTSDLYKKDDEK